MSANYDRSKGEYKTKEDDTLFQVLSKTYVRNLDKILTRKKKLDEDAASAPSEPSAP
jgi:hemerythrin-like domain-containing protein